MVLDIYFTLCCCMQSVDIGYNFIIWDESWPGSGLLARSRYQHMLAPDPRPPANSGHSWKNG